MSRVVYSTDKGRLCPDCEQVVTECICKQRIPQGDGVIRIQRETKGRKGKGVTLVSGFLLDDKALKQQAKQLKQLCGTGGSVKNGIIEIQGDHRITLQQALLEKGFVVKISGS